jgi:TPR repeat protein
MRRLVVLFSLFLLSSSFADAEVWFDRGCGKITNDCKGEVQSLYIFGSISPETRDQIQHFALTYPQASKFPIVYINSNGGSASVAMDLGRLLRAKKARIEAEDRFFPDRLPHCASACVLVASGAVTRNLLHMGLHQGYLTVRLKNGELRWRKKADETTQKVAAYLDKMNVSDALLRVQDPYQSANGQVDIWFDSQLPFESQLIAQFGFRMRRPDEAETQRLKAYTELSSDLKSLEFAARELNDSDAMGDLALAYLQGEDGLATDKNKGIAWLEKSAQLGSPNSQHNLAVISANGLYGVKPDKAKAINLYRKSAAQGHSGAQTHLGWIYYRGDGVKKSLSEGIYWITRSAEQGEPFAYAALAQIFADGNGFIRNDSEIYKWFRLALDKMPQGSPRNELDKQFKKFSAKLTPSQVSEGDKLAQNWHPLKQSYRLLRNRE